LKIAVLYSSHAKTSSYFDDWLDAFKNIKNSNISVNLFNSSKLSRYKSQKILLIYEYVVFLHSTNSNGFKLPNLFRYGSLNLRKSKVVFFVGNEYKLMPAKINFIKLNNIDFVVSQHTKVTAEWLYKETKSKIISLPHALNIDSFKFENNLNNRSIDVGARSYTYPWFLGDNDRLKSLSILRENSSEFILDISTDPDKRFNRVEWAKFLNNCKFTISSESGPSHLERDDRTRKLVNKFIDENPGTTFEDVYDRFFKDYQGKVVSGKIISPRHFEAIGTKTCQILLEGKYNDILKPDKHYIELKKDFSNIMDVIEKMKNKRLRKEIVDRAYEYVLDRHTYQHRIKFLLDEITK